jgi:hypothetical protein
VKKLFSAEILQMDESSGKIDNDRKDNEYYQSYE